MLKISIESFLIILDQDTIGNVQSALDQLEADGYVKPRYLVVQTGQGQFVGILEVGDIVLAASDELVSQQPAIAIKRRQVDIGAPEEEKVATVRSSQGLALAVKGGHPVGVLRTMELATDTSSEEWSPLLQTVDRSISTQCPRCGRRVTGYQTVRLTRPDGKVEHRHVCPICHKVVGRSAAESTADATQVEDKAKSSEETRYLNTYFARQAFSLGVLGLEGDEKVPFDSTLQSAERYWLAVDIGPDRSQSNAMDDIVFPTNEELGNVEQAEAEGGRMLEVALYSQDFELLEDERSLWLPLYGPTDHLFFPLLAPSEHGLAQLRVCVYYQNNLVQSQVVYAYVDDIERPDRGGNWAETEYTLSAVFGDLGQLRPRGLNLVYNQGLDGTHTLLVKDKDLKNNSFDLRDEMTKAVTRFREVLDNIMFQRDGDDIAYRLNRRANELNWGNEETIKRDLLKLADLGSTWYRDLFGEEKLDLEDELRSRLNEPTTIQIVRAKGKHIFPWSVMYDLPWVRSASTVCLRFREHRTDNHTLDYAACKANCPHLDRTETPPQHSRDVACVFGFWGIKHIVEQPLSASIKLEDTDEPRRHAPGGLTGSRIASSVRTAIKYEGRPAVHIGISHELELVEEHLGALHDTLKDTTVESWLSEPDRSFKEIGSGLQSTPLHVYYLFCHGGQQESEDMVWFRVGDGEWILPEHLRYSWRLTKQWRDGEPTQTPLVFLNGCGTLSLSTESVAEFLAELTRAGAAGVIGTEISVDERLAHEVGLGFLQAFAAGQAAGAIIRDVRQALLLKYNPLGLVYTPYCYAELHLQAKS